MSECADGDITSVLSRHKMKRCFVVGCMSVCYICHVSSQHKPSFRGWLVGRFVISNSLRWMPSPHFCSPPVETTLGSHHPWQLFRWRDDADTETCASRRRRCVYDLFNDEQNQLKLTSSGFKKSTWSASRITPYLHRKIP